MKKILTICPSIHPKKLTTMMDSFLSTSNNSDIKVYTKIDSITNIFNKSFQENPDYDFYHMTNDDCVYLTDNWDIELAKKGKISYGNDMFQMQHMCTFPMIDGNIVRALGWLQLPTLNRYCGDVVWNFIGNGLKILDYNPNVIIQHNWEGCADLEMNKSDMAEFARWLPNSFKDMAKLRRILG